MSADPDPRLDDLMKAVEAYAAHVGPAMRFSLVIEVMSPTGPTLLHRGRDLAGGIGLQPWHEIGMHRAGLLLAERDLVDWTRPARENDDDEPPG